VYEVPIPLAAVLSDRLWRTLGRIFASLPFSA
jgi:hypothetical protein